MPMISLIQLCRATTDNLDVKHECTVGRGDTRTVTITFSVSASNIREADLVLGLPILSAISLSFGATPKEIP